MTVSLIERGLALTGLPSDEIAAIARITGGRHHSAKAIIPQAPDIIRFDPQESIIVFSSHSISLYEPETTTLLTEYYVVPFEEHVLFVAPEHAPENTPIIRIQNGIITREPQQ